MGDSSLWEGFIGIDSVCVEIRSAHLFHIFIEEIQNWVTVPGLPPTTDMIKPRTPGDCKETEGMEGLNSSLVGISSPPRNNGHPGGNHKAPLHSHSRTWKTKVSSGARQ